MRFIHEEAAAAGHRVNYLCAEDVPAGLRGRVGRIAFPFLVRRRVVAAAQAGDPYDVLNVHEPSAAVVASLRGSTGGPVVVVTSHGVERRAWELALEERRLRRAGPSLRTRLVYPLTGLWQSDVALRHADHVFCLSFEDRDYLTQRLGLSPRRITRIYPAADPIYAERAKHRDYTRAERILFAGTWRKNKGIEDLVPAFVALAVVRPRLTLTLLGPAVPRAVVERAFPRELHPRITCLETVTDQETARALADADIYLLPSLFEGTPLTLIEAMMSGLPIVTTNTCGMKDVIQNGTNGLLVPIRSPEAIVTALQTLLEDAAYRAQLGRAAQAEALRNYVWNEVAAPVQEVYANLCRREGQ